MSGPLPRRGTPLTAREREVLHRMADGRGNVDIGQDLFVGLDTVRTHVRRVFAKLGAANRAHAVAIAYRTGLLTDVPAPEPPPPVGLPATDVRVWRLTEALRRWDGRYTGAVLPESARLLRRLLAEALKET